LFNTEIRLDMVFAAPPPPTSMPVSHRHQTLCVHAGLRRITPSNYPVGGRRENRHRRRRRRRRRRNVLCLLAAGGVRQSLRVSTCIRVFVYVYTCVCVRLYVCVYGHTVATVSGGLLIRLAVARRGAANRRFSAAP